MASGIFRFALGSRIVVTKDQGKFFAGDVFVIDAIGVNYEQRIDYCERNEKCWAEGPGYSIETRWSKVRRTNGSEGWVRDPIRNLDGVLRSD